MRPQPLHSIRWCLSHLWHTRQGHSGLWVMLALGSGCSSMSEPWEERDRSETALAARQEGCGQGHQGHLNTSQGKAPSPQGPSCSVPGASELELQSPSSLQPLPGKGVSEPELGLVCRSLALIPSSSSSLLSLLAGFVELDLPAKESPCRPCRADIVLRALGHRGFISSIFLPFSRSRASKAAGPQCAAADDQGAAGAAQAAPGPAGKAAGSD